MKERRVLNGPKGFLVRGEGAVFFLNIRSRLIVIRGATVNRTYGIHKNQYI